MICEILIKTDFQIHKHHRFHISLFAGDIRIAQLLHHSFFSKMTYRKDEILLK